MMCFMGAKNTSGFSSKISSGLLSSPDHLTYSGAFNELDFEVGQKSKNLVDIHLGFARASNPSSSYDNKINEFLGLFIKSNRDGEPRDETPLNAVIILDISGSMNSLLQNGGKQTRMTLAKQAIKMFVSKLRPNDSFGLVTFNTTGSVVIKPMRKDEIDVENVCAVVDAIQVNGGTALSSGFETGAKVLNQFLEKTKSPSSCENRLVMLTDVNDNSAATTQQFISKVSHKNIHTTIIGVSADFRSDICESLTKIKGFNYFSAVNENDLKKYLFEDFDWTFFPAAHEIEIRLKSNNVRMFEVFGTSDEKDVKSYNDFAKKGQNEFVITKTATAFPSQLKIEKGIVKTVGGLILVKLSPQSQLTEFTGEVELTYSSNTGQKFKKVYPIKYQFPKNQQFFTDKSLEQAISGFYFVYETKQLLQEANQKENSLNKQKNKRYLESFKELLKIAPENKIKDIQGIIKILEEKAK